MSNERPSQNIRFNSLRLNRPHQFNAACEIADILFDDSGQSLVVKNKFCSLWAPLKWGKREVLDILPLWLAHYGNNLEFIYVRPPRVDLRPQEDELILHHWLMDDKEEPIIKNYNKDKLYVIAFDEADFGDGQNQNFHKRFNEIKHHPNVCLLGVSATNFTFLYSLEKRFLKNSVIGKSYPNYIGLDNFSYNIVKERPFDKKYYFTKSFENEIRKWAKATNDPNNKKTKFIVRDTTFNGNTELVLEQLYDIFNEECGHKKISVVLVDQAHKYKWKKNNPDAWVNSGNELFIVKQTFTRGTETDIQPFTYQYYDFRKKTTPLNTIAQALGRFANYSGTKDIILSISEEHYKYVKIYLEIQQELSNGKKLNELLEVEKYSDILLTGKLRPKAQRVVSRSYWQYNFIDAKGYDILPTITPTTTFNSPDDDWKKRIKKAIINHTNADGRWDNLEKNGTQAQIAYLIFENSLLTDEDKTFIKENCDNVYSLLEKHNYVVVSAEPFQVEYIYDINNFKVLNEEEDNRFKGKHAEDNAGRYRRTKGDPNRPEDENNNRRSYDLLMCIKDKKLPLLSGYQVAHKTFNVILDKELGLYDLTKWKNILTDQIIDNLHHGKSVVVVGTRQTKKDKVSKNIYIDKSSFPDLI